MPIRRSRQFLADQIDNHVQYIPMKPGAKPHGEKARIGGHDVNRPGAADHFKKIATFLPTISAWIPLFTLHWSSLANVLLPIRSHSQTKGSHLKPKPPNEFPLDWWISDHVGLKAWEGRTVEYSDPSLFSPSLSFLTALLFLCCLGGRRQVLSCVMSESRRREDSLTSKN